MARPVLSIVVFSTLALFFLAVSTEAMARSSGPGGGRGSGGGYGGGRSGGIRGAQPGAFRLQRVYGNPNRPARDSRPTSTTRPETRQRPGAAPPPRSGQESLTGQRHPAVSPGYSPGGYQNITEKYERLREARHKEYWDRRQQGQ